MTGLESRRDSGESAKIAALRGLAAIAVMSAHIVQIYQTRLLGPESPFVTFTGNLARHAVLVFFLLSGYLITRSIRANTRRFGRFSASEYLISRITRIYPPLLGTVLLVCAIWAIIHGLSLPGSTSYGLPGDLYVVRNSYYLNGGEVIRALLMQGGMTGADGPLWSLYIEAHVYVVAMFVAMAATGRWLPGIVGALLVTGYALLRVDGFFFFALVWAMGAAATWPGRGLLTVLACVAAGTLAGAAIVTPGLLDIGGSSPFAVYGVQVLSCIVYLYLIFIRKEWFESPRRWMVSTADFSYSLYVIHFPLLLLGLSLTQSFMGHSLGRTLLVSAAMAGVTLLLAWRFARFFENQPYFKPHVRRLVEKLSGRVA